MNLPHDESKQSQKWYANYNLLKEYKDKFGHCNVSYCSNEYSSLYNWVRKQRNEYTKMKSQLTNERIDLLNDIGFKWSTKKTLTELVNEIEIMLKNVKTKKQHRKSESIKMEWLVMVGRGVNQYMFKTFEHRHNLPGKKHLGVNMMDVYDKKKHEPWELELYDKAAEILKLLDPEYMGEHGDWSVHFSKFGDVSKNSVHMHRDMRDVSYSYSISFGDYVGMKWRVQKLNGSFEEFCDKRTFVKFDARLPHCYLIDRESFSGSAYQVIYFKNYDRRQVKEDDLCDPEIIRKV